MRLIVLIAVFLCGSQLARTEPVKLPANCSSSPMIQAISPTGQAGAWPAGHAHNDYLHSRPLNDALDAGFSSVEADVWAQDGELLVAHTHHELDRSRTLRHLYLDQLADRYARDPDAAPVQLVIDVKSDDDDTVPLLRAELSEYAAMLTSYRGCVRTAGPVSVVVGGTVRPEQPDAKVRTYFGYDFQPEGVTDPGLGSAVTPLVSARWDSFFTWSGGGTMPSEQRSRLRDIVTAAHAVGARIRLWRVPDDRGAQRDRIWAELARAGVDYISTDDLAGYADRSDSVSR